MLIIGTFLKGMTVKGLIAGLGITVIFSLIVYLLMIMVFSYQSRRAAVKVRLPAIDGYGEDAFSMPEFKEPKQFIVELIDLNEDTPQNSKPNDEVKFISALTLETRKYIPTEQENIIMPKIEIDVENSIINEAEDLSIQQKMSEVVSDLGIQENDKVYENKILDNEERD